MTSSKFLTFCQISSARTGADIHGEGYYLDKVFKYSQVDLINLIVSGFVPFQVCRERGDAGFKGR